MKLQVEIELDNAAFQSGTGHRGIREVRRILTDITTRLPLPLKETAGELILHDVNGNWAGYARVVAGEIATERLP
jgi:hypothetical protein